MKNGAAGFREAGSFLAGLLIGLSIVLAVFVLMVGDSTEWASLWIFLPLIVLALGFALHASSRLVQQTLATSET
jgi:hypothetical protein